MRHLAVAMALASLQAEGEARAADFTGPDTCKACHPAAYAAWRDSGHSRATASLTPKQQSDGRCLSCHAPDLGKGVGEVSCESCHGGGQLYSPRYVMKDAELARAVGLLDPTEKICLKCHDQSAPSIRPFDFVEKLKRIDHWTGERAARKARQPDARPPEVSPPDTKTPRKAGKRASTDG